MIDSDHNNSIAYTFTSCKIRFGSQLFHKIPGITYQIIGLTPFIYHK